MDDSTNTPKTQPEHATYINPSAAGMRIGMIAPTVKTGPRKITVTIGGKRAITINYKNGRIVSEFELPQPDAEDALGLLVNICRSELIRLQESRQPEDSRPFKNLTLVEQPIAKRIIEMQREGRVTDRDLAARLTEERLALDGKSINERQVKHIRNKAGIPAQTAKRV
jgi:hypothetical protein